MQHHERKCVPFNSARPAIQKRQHIPIKHIDIYQVIIRHSRIRTIRYHRHHDIIVFLISDRQQRPYDSHKSDIRHQHQSKQRITISYYFLYHLVHSITKLLESI